MSKKDVLEKKDPWKTKIALAFLVGIILIAGILSFLPAQNDAVANVDDTVSISITVSPGVQLTQDGAKVEPSDVIGENKEAGTITCLYYLTAGKDYKLE